MLESRRVRRGRRESFQKAKLPNDHVRRTRYRLVDYLNTSDVSQNRLNYTRQALQRVKTAGISSPSSELLSGRTPKLGSLSLQDCEAVGVLTISTLVPETAFAELQAAYNAPQATSAMIPATSAVLLVTESYLRLSRLHTDIGFGQS